MYSVFFSFSFICVRSVWFDYINKLDGCIVWNADNTAHGEEARLIYIVPVCYVKKQVGMEKPSNIIISLHRKKISIITNIPLIIS